METGVIQKRLKILDDLVHEITKLKASLEDALMDDPNYGKMVEEEEETKKIKKETPVRAGIFGIQNQISVIKNSQGK